MEILSEDNASILIVEDESIVAENLRRKLERIGYAVAGPALSAEETLAMIREHQPDLILIDIQLNGPLDGIQITAKIRAIFDVPVIYLTAHSDPDTLARAKATDPFGYILKPFAARDLANQVELAIYKHKADRLVREQREWFQVTLSSIGDAVIATDARGHITFINPVAEALSGWKSPEVIDRPIGEVFRIINEQTCRPVNDPVSEVLRTRQIVPLSNHTAIITKDDRTVPIEDSAAPIVDFSGELIGVVLVFHDVTAKRSVETKLSEISQRLALATKSANIGIWDWDFSDNRLIWDDRMLELYGETRQSFMGNVWAWKNRLHPDDRDEIWQKCQAALQGESSWDVEFRILTTTGTTRYIKADGYVIRNDAGEPIRMLGTNMDITAQKKAELALQNIARSLEEQVLERSAVADARSRQLQSLAIELIEAEERERRRIADLLHDDLQQMLAAARMQLDALCRRQSDGPGLQNVLNLLSDAIEKSRNLSHELSPPALQHSNLTDAFQWIAQFFNERFSMDVKLNIQTALSWENNTLKVFLFRTVQELLFNVVKHGKVNQAQIDLIRQDGFLALSVSDRGRGFDPEGLDLPRRGLGLMSIRERACYIGGELLMDSTPGRGSRVTLRVPVSIESDVPQETGSAKGWESAARMELLPSETTGVIRVLFADDHEVMRQGLINLMEDQPGIHVVGEAANGKQAVERSEQLKPNVVLMDVSMPEMDGIEATRNIKADSPEIRVVGLSMHAENHIKEAMRNAGADDFVSKTASPAELLQAIYGHTKFN